MILTTMDLLNEIDWLFATVHQLCIYNGDSRYDIQSFTFITR